MNHEQERGSYSLPASAKHPGQRCTVGGTSRIEQRPTVGNKNASGNLSDLGIIFHLPALYMLGIMVPMFVCVPCPPHNKTRGNARGKTKADRKRRQKYMKTRNSLTRRGYERGPMLLAAKDVRIVSSCKKVVVASQPPLPPLGQQRLASEVVVNLPPSRSPRPVREARIP